MTTHVSRQFCHVYCSSQFSLMFLILYFVHSSCVPTWSAVEPSTTRGSTCVSCGKRWKRCLSVKPATRRIQHAVDLSLTSSIWMWNIGCRWQKMTIFAASPTSCATISDMLVTFRTRESCSVRMWPRVGLISLQWTGSFNTTRRIKLQNTYTGLGERLGDRAVREGRARKWFV